MFRVGIITASDSGYAGKREDVSGAVIKEIAAANGYQVTSYTMKITQIIAILFFELFAIYLVEITHAATAYRPGIQI